MESKKEEEQKKIQKKISIIGAGPVGLYAAYLFSQDKSNDVTVYEKRTKDKYNIRPQVLYLATKHNDDYSAFNLTEQHKEHIRDIHPDLDFATLEKYNLETREHIEIIENKMNSSSCGYPDAINNTGTSPYNYRLQIDVKFRSSVSFNAKMKKEMEKIISKLVSGQVLEGEVSKHNNYYYSADRIYLRHTVPSRLVSFSIDQNTKKSALGGGAKFFDIEINIIVGCYINNNEEESSKWEQWKDAIKNVLTSEKIKFMLSASSVFSSKMRNIEIDEFVRTFKAEDQTKTSVTPEPSKLLGVGCNKPASNDVTLKHRTISIFNLQDSLYNLCKKKNNITIKFGINLISQLKSNGSFLPKSDFIIVATGTPNIYSDRHETALLKSMNRTKKIPTYKDLPLNDPTQQNVQPPQNYGMTVHIPCSFLKNYETIDSKTSYIDKQHRWRLFPQYDSEGISNYCTEKLSDDDRKNSSNNNKNYAYYLGINLTESEFNTYKKKDNDGGRYKISDISDEYELQKDQLINFIKMILTMNNISYNDELNWGNLKISTFTIDLTYVDTKEESVDKNDNTPNIFYKENITILDKDENEIVNFFDTVCKDLFPDVDVYNILNINVLKNRRDEESEDSSNITQNKILILKELFMMSDKALFAIAFKFIGLSRYVDNVEFVTMSEFANKFDIKVSNAMQSRQSIQSMQLEDVFYDLDEYFHSLDDTKKERILYEIRKHPVYKFAIEVKNMKKKMQHMENGRATTNENYDIHEILEEDTPLVFVGDSLIKVHFLSGSGINIGLMTVYILYLLYRYKKDIEGKDLKFDEIAQFYSSIFENKKQDLNQDLNLIEQLLKPSAEIAWESKDLWNEWDRNKTQLTFNDLKSKYTHLLNLHTEHESNRDEEIICKLLEHIKTSYLSDYNNNTENGKFHFAGVSKSDKHISCDDKSTLTNKFKRFVSNPSFTRKKMKKIGAGKKRRKKTRKS